MSFFRRTSEGFLLLSSPRGLARPAQGQAGSSLRRGAPAPAPATRPARPDARPLVRAGGPPGRPAGPRPSAGMMWMPGVGPDGRPAFLPAMMGPGGFAPGAPGGFGSGFGSGFAPGALLAQMAAQMAAPASAPAGPDPAGFGPAGSLRDDLGDRQANKCAFRTT